MFFDEADNENMFSQQPMLMAAANSVMNNLGTGN